MPSFEKASDYTVRWFDERDREPFLSLYAETFSGGGDEWFEWKYVDNPRVDQVPILVADADGEFAGARAQVPFLMRAGGEDVVVNRFGDTMVHPDHRRRGVFSRLTEHALDHYEGTDTQFCFNCPNDLSLPGFLKAGGEIVAQYPSYYRIQNPDAFAGSRDDAVGLAARLASPAVRGYLAVRDSLRTPPKGVSVTRHADPPVDLLSSLYEEGHPDTLHAVRDKTFLNWRYGNPDWEYRALSASVDGRSQAALVTGHQTTDEGVSKSCIVDVLPLERSQDRARALRALLSAVLEDTADDDLVGYSGRSIPESILREYGLHFDGAFPLDRVTNPTNLVAYDVTGDDGPAWMAGDVNLREAESWGLSYTELDGR